MVCKRCFIIVQNELDKLGLSAINIKCEEVFEKEQSTEI